MVIQPQTGVDTTRHARVRRHCSTICIALVVARFTPASTLAGPVSPDAAHVAASAAPAASTLYLSARFCLLQERCGSLAATITPGPSISASIVSTGE